MSDERESWNEYAYEYPSETVKIGWVEFEKWISNRINDETKPLTKKEDDEDNPQQHPLLNPIILEKIFLHRLAQCDEDDIDDDEIFSIDPSTSSSLNNLRSHRLVCQTWNHEVVRIMSSQYTCRSPGDIKALLDLVLSPNTKVPFLRNLSLKYNDIWKTPETFQLLWNVQDSLKTLELAALELEYCPLMILPKVCPGLQKLTLHGTNCYPDVNWNNLQPFEDQWIKPFPKLKELKIINGAFTKVAAKLVLSLLKRTKSIKVLEIQADSGFGRDDGVVIFGEEIMGKPWETHPEMTGRLEKFHLETFNCDGFMTGITNRYLIHPSNCFRNLSTFTLVQRPGSLFSPISSIHLEESLSKLIQEIAHSLKNLTVVNSCELGLGLGVLDDANPIGKLILPVMMPKLEFLCLGNVGLNIDLNVGNKNKFKGTGTGQKESWGFAKIFPNLQHFEFWIRIFNDLSDDDKKIIFETLFPQKAEENDETDNDNNNVIHNDDVTIDEADIQKNLVNLHVYTRFKIGHEQVLKEIATKFTALKSLMLEMDGELLSDAVDLLKTLNIEHFSLVYYETRNGTKDFDGAATGIPSSICFNLVEESKNDRDSLEEKKLDQLKTASSFTEWKSLSRFNISYRHGGVFDVVFLTFCLQLMKKLKHLELRHFDITENLLIRLIKKTNLVTLVLGNCKVIPFDEDFPVIGYTLGIEDIVSKYKKNVKISFVGYEGTSEIDCIPYYAKLLHHFDYDNQLADLVE